MKVNKKELYGALMAVVNGLSKTVEIEQTGSFIFTKKHVYTFNDEIAFYHPVNVDLFEGAISAKEFLPFLKTLKKNEIDMEILEETTLQVKCGRSKAKFALDSEIKIPIIAECETWKPIPEGLLTAIQFCEVTVADDASLSILTCVHVNGKVVESSDNYRYTRHMIPEACEDDLLIPKYALKHISNHSPLVYGKVEGWILFKNEVGGILACRTFPNAYPDVSQIRKVTGKAFTFPDELEDELEKASIFASGIEGELPTVIIQAKEGKMAVRATNDVSEFRGTLKLTDKEAKFKIQVPPKFLQDALNMTEECIISKHNIKLSGADFEHIVTLTI